jgi:hypothetical protein
MPGFKIGDKDGGGNPGDANSADSKLLGKDVKRSHRWRIVKLGTIDNNPILSQDELLFAKSVTMPNIGFEEHYVLGGSIAYKFATRPEFGDLVLAFYDLDGIEPKIRRWQELVWRPAQGVGVANEYKDEVILYLTDGFGEPVDDAWKFINAWPKIINHGELVYDSSDFKLITMTISYDWIEYPTTSGSATRPSEDQGGFASARATGNLNSLVPPPGIGATGNI